MNLIVYDFDGTIYDGDSTMDFLKFLITKKIWLVIFIPLFVFNFIRYKLKFITKEKLKESIFSIFRYFDNIDELLIEFWERKEKKLKPFFKNKKNHKNDVIATASPEFLIKPIADKYKVKKLFGSLVDKKTGKYSRLNCYGEEKIVRINSVFSNAIISEVYSDDCVADKPLLDLAKKSYIVKKNEIISYEGNTNKFKVREYFKKNKEIVDYLIIGVLTVLVNIITKYILLFTIFDAKNSDELQFVIIISWVVAVLFAYATNRKVVFKSKNQNIIKEFIAFVESRILTLLIEMIFMYIFVTLLKFNTDLLVSIFTIVSQFIVIVLNYIFSKLFVFNKNRN